MVGARDRGFERLTISIILGPFTDDAIERIIEGVRLFLLSPAGENWRRVRHGGGWAPVSVNDTERLARLAADAVTIDHSIPDLRALNIAALGHPFTELPLRLHVANGFVVFTMSHALADATGAAHAVHTILRLARDGSAGEVAAPVLSHRPLRATMRRFGFDSPRGVARARRLFRELNTSVIVPAEFDALAAKREAATRIGFSFVSIDAPTLARISAVSEPARTGDSDGDARPVRPTLRMKVASLALAALRDIAVDDSEFRVVVPVDARRYLPRSGAAAGEVSGNFSPSIPIGRLRADNWSPTRLTRVISQRIKSGVPVAWMVATVVIGAKTAALRGLARRRAAPERVMLPLQLLVSLPSSSVGVPASFWRPGAARVVSGAPAHTEVALGTLLEVIDHDDLVTVTVWDETGIFEVDRFEQALNTRVAEWVSPRVAG